MAYEQIGIWLTQNLAVLYLIMAWELAWKAIALWKSARNKHLIWFIAILIFNTIGILPILYIVFFQKKAKKKKK